MRKRINLITKIGILFSLFITIFLFTIPKTYANYYSGNIWSIECITGNSYISAEEINYFCNKSSDNDKPIKIYRQDNGLYTIRITTVFIDGNNVGTTLKTSNRYQNYNNYSSFSGSQCCSIDDTTYTSTTIENVDLNKKTSHIIKIISERLTSSSGTSAYYNEYDVLFTIIRNDSLAKEPTVTVDDKVIINDTTYTANKTLTIKCELGISRTAYITNGDTKKYIYDSFCSETASPNVLDEIRFDTWGTGYYSITVANNALPEKEATYTFYIDDSIPKLNVNVKDGASTNSSVKISATKGYEETSVTISSIKITDSNNKEVKATTNGDEFSYTPSADGKYTITATQSNGKTATSTFIYDTTAPTGTLSSEQMGPNKEIKFTYKNNENCSIIFNGNVIETGKKEGTVTINNSTNGLKKTKENLLVIQDDVGNSNTYKFTYDDVAPEGSFDSTICSPNKAANFSWTEDNVTLKIYNSDNTKEEQTITYTSKSVNVYSSTLAAGTYYLRIYDINNNYSSYKYIQEKNFDTEINASRYYINDVNPCSFSWENGKELTVKIEGNDFSGNPIENSFSGYTSKYTLYGSNWGEGELKVTFITKGLLTQSFTIVNDKTAPTTNLTNKGYYKSLTVNWTEDNDYYATYQLDNGNLQTLNRGDKFTKDGKYFISIVDKSRNELNLVCFVDSTPVAITSSQINNSYYSSAQKVSISDANLPTISTSYYIFNDKDKYNIQYTSEKLTNTFSEEGKYELHIFDLSNNETVITFYIDLHDAVITGITNNAHYNTLPNVTWKDNYGIKSVTINDTLIQQWTDYLFPTTSDYASYKLVVTDLANRKSEINFIYDTVAPVGTLIRNNIEMAEVEIEVNGSQNFKLKCENTDIIKITFYDSTGLMRENANNISLNPNDYSEGKGYFKCEDLAGNVTYYYVNIDCTPVKYDIFVSGSKTNQKAYYNTDISINWNEDNAKAFLKKETEDYLPYSKNSKIATLDNTTVEFEFYIIDSAGNESETYKFIIDKEIDNKNYNYLSSKNYNRINEWYNTYSYSLSNKSLIVEKYYSFATQEEALYYANQREIEYVEKIKYNDLVNSGYQTKNFGNITTCYSGDLTLLANITANPDSYVYIYKDMSKPGAMCFYISTTSYENAKQYFINNSVTHHYRYFNSEDDVKAAYNSDLYMDCFYINGIEYTLSHQEIDTIVKYKTSQNGSYITSSKLTGSPSNTYYVMEIDRAENVIEYVVKLDSTANKYSVQTQNGINTIYTQNLINSKEIYIKENVTIIPDEESVTTKLFKNGEFVAYYNSIAFSLDETAIYTFFGYDASGNKSSTYTVYLNKEELNISFEMEFDEEGQYSGVNLKINNTNLTTKDFIAFVVERDGSVIYEDDNGTQILEKNKTYFFNTSATYFCQIIDIYGNNVIKEVTLTLNAPVGLLYCDGIQIQDNGYITYKAIYLDWNKDKDYTALLDGKSYTRNAWITSEGSHTIALINGGDVDNAKLFTFTIDKQKPVGSIIIDGIKNEGNSATTSSNNVCFSWDNSEYITATLNGENYISGNSITKEGINTIELTSKAGVTNKYSITLDFTPPIVEIYAGTKLINNGAITNNRICFKFTESKCVASVNGSPYVSGTYFNQQGTYTLLIADRYNNQAVFSVTIDLTNPIINAYNASTDELIPFNSKINTPFYLDWTDESYKVYVDDVLYTAGTIISAEKDGNVYNDENKKYVIKAINEAGTINEKNMFLSYLEPTYSLYAGQTQIFDGYTTNKSINLKPNKFVDYIMVNDMVYNSGAILSQSGTYTFTIFGTYGTNVTSTIIVDKEAPIIELIGVEDNGYTNKSVTLSCNETVTATYSNGSIYNMGDEISEDGYYVITVVDKALNKSTVSFTIKKSLPEYSISTTIYNQKYVNTNFSITSNEKIYCNGSPYVSGTTIKSENSYTFVIQDKALNEISFTIIYDKQPASYTVSGLSESSVYTNKPVTFEFDSQSVTATLNGEDYISGTEITIDGTYYFSCVGFNNISNNLTFYISTNKPKGQLYTKQGDINNNSKTNIPVAFSWDDNSKVICDGKEYSKGTYIKDDGFHQFIITNIYGTSATYSVEISTVLPEGKLNNVNEKGYSNKIVTFTYNEELYTATINDFAYLSDAEIVSDNSYCIILRDEYGNEQEYNFIIKTSLPIYEIEGIEDGKVKTANNVYIRWTDPTIVKALLNEKEYTSGTRIYNEKIYVFECWDLANNYSSFEFEISKNLPKYEVEGFVTYNNKTNNNVTFYFDDNCSATINNIPYYSGMTISESNNYIFVITNDIGVSDSFSFIIDKISPEYEITTTSSYGFVNNVTNGKVKIVWNENNCKCYINGSDYTLGRTISEANTYEVELLDYLGNVTAFSFEINLDSPVYEIYGLTNEKELITNSPFSIYCEACTVICNDENFNINNLIREEGIYNFTITNIYGTSTSFTVVYDTTPEEANLNFDDNNTMFFDEENYVYYTNGKVNVSFNNKLSSLYVNGEEQDTSKLSFTLKEEGNYSIFAQDEATNISFYDIRIIKSFNKPILNTSQNGGFLKDNKTNGIVTLVSEESSLKAKFEGVKGGQEYIFGTEISEDGKYSIIVEDFLGNFCVYDFSISKEKPVYTLTNVENNGYTNKNVKISWEDSKTIGSYILNDDITTEKVFENGKVFKDDGCYTVSLINDYGNVSNITFEINTTELDYGTLTGVEINEYTDKSFNFSWEKNELIINIVLPSGEELNYGSYIEDSEENIKSIDFQNYGLYKFTITNKYGNIAIFECHIDDIKPVLTLTGVENGGKTKNKVKCLVEEDNIKTLVLNSYDPNTKELLKTKDYENNSNISSNGLYSIVCEDMVGHIIEVTFEIKSEDIKSISKNMIQQEEYSFYFVSYDHSLYSIYVNGTLCENSEEIYETPGYYDIVIKDNYGNEYNTSITIKAPNVKDYTIQNLLSFVALGLVMIVVVVIIVKKFKNGTKNIYKMK